MQVYLDNAATTPVAPEVVEAMIPILKEGFGNPSSSHFFGRQLKAQIETARRSIAKHINCSPAEIIFTSGGTEADNMAIAEAVNSLGVKRIVTTTIEHHAVGHTATSICDKNDIELVYVKIDEKGQVDMTDLKTILSDGKKTLVSLMHANNEIATLLPIEEVSKICREKGAFFHSDTVQTMGHYPFDLQKLDIDFITCAAHKFHGPKGVGFLYINKNVRIHSMIHGGAQERGLRGGTENTSGIVGLSKAFDLAYKDVAEHQKYVQGLKNHMISQLRKNMEGVEFHGEIDPNKSLYTVLNVCLPKTEKSGLLLFTLDLKGIACSGGSACSSGAVLGSHVLAGINAPSDKPNARFSFSRYTTKEEIDFTIGVLKEIYTGVLV
ncbi:cysteine desulfurase [Crocinitomicaceae bacterium]|jgi:cysteine desulfurase|nr:cysteine desulfurase [Crocinitomicaceae bacterium]MDG1347564.1 cysteine desulfurase family protein [Crocinitomicaceae bacterium]